MEGAQLRPVPARPPGPVDPGEAAQHVREALPALDEPAAQALALATLVGRSREEMAGEVDVAGENLADVLARGRKALRRSRYPLPGSGWCERAERLISDRMDGELAPPGPARLEVHLRNCARCVEHERKLAQATDSLVASFVEEHPAPAQARKPGRQEPAPAAPLRVVEPAPARAEASSNEDDRLRFLPAALGGLSVAGLPWYAVFALAVLLAIALVALAVVGILSGPL
jgi:Putative zinc-finger